jgi:hypothetical protein
VTSFEKALKLVRAKGEAPLDLQEPRGGANRLSQKIGLSLAFAKFQV